VTIRAVVFDFDGVIANSEPLHLQGFCRVLAEEGLDLSESDYYGRYLGFDDEGTFEAIAADRGVLWTRGHIAKLVRRKAACLEILEHAQSVLFPGARKAIERLSAACPLAIASGALRSEIRRILDREDLARYFLVVVGAEDTQAGKPAPDPYLRALNLLGAARGVTLSPRDCVAVEDSRWGLQSAAAAGLRTVGITHTYPAEALSGAEIVVSHLDALTWDLLTSSLN
jgi:HAD superfamily hydrolase (TIGR01509 family)